MKKPVVLCILDGCGIRKERRGNAFYNANMKTLKFLWDNYPHCELNASGKFVGLPCGQMGNSEVGHLNIGAGRVVYQPLEIINKSIEDKSFYSNSEILKVIKHVKNNNSKLHLFGLLSDGGVHSHINHLIALLRICKNNDLENICIHVCADGRDVDPKSLIKYIDIIKKENIGKIASISGRYYAMDRDNNYDRLKKSYDVIVNGKGPHENNIEKYIDDSYNCGITDEFLIPTIFKDNCEVSDNDGFIAFNFRKDRNREMLTALTNDTFKEFEIKNINNLKVLTLFPVVKSVIAPYAFDDINLKNILGEYIEINNLSQLRIAETEKFAHVTFFFDGGKEKDYKNENKILIPSPKVATYDLMPEMSSEKITETLIDELDKDKYDLVILNYANGDMVGHTGNYDAAVEGLEYLDKCLERLYKKVEEKSGTLVITADHGNCDVMLDENNNIVTSHTTNKVPFIVTNNDYQIINDDNNKLADIAPSILQLLNVEVPNEMTGKKLFEKYVEKC